MKSLRSALMKKSIVFFIVVIGFLIGPSLAAQNTYLSDDNTDEKTGSSIEKPSPVIYDLLIIAPKNILMRYNR
jgi:hypothetical protein